MVKSVSIAATAASLLFVPCALAEGLYSKSSPVLNLDQRKYHSWISTSNHTSIVEFYAPWCGHCKNLKPIYEKAAKSLAGLANVAAVNCDDEENKMFCQTMGVQGFPTLKLVRPGKKAGKPSIEEYQGQRTAKAIVDTVIDTIPNHVKRLKDADYKSWLTDGSGPKTILFSDKGVVGGLLKAVAVDFLGVLEIGQIRSNQKAAVDDFGIDKFPTLVLIPGQGRESITYDGDLKKDPIISFLSQAAAPNPNPIKEGKLPKNSSSKQGKSSQGASKFKKSSASQASKQMKTDKASQTLVSLEDDPTESPSPQVDTPKPVKVADTATPIQSLPDGLSLQQECLNDKAGTCILLLLPEDSADIESLKSLRLLSEIQHKHSSGGRKLFPFYQLPYSNSQATSLRAKLNLAPNKPEIVATNGKRGWWRHQIGSEITYKLVETWIDAIRMGDIPKLELPADLVANAADLPARPAQTPDDHKVAEMKESLKDQIPEGLDFEFEEISDEDYERLTKQGKAEEHDEL